MASASRVIGRRQLAPVGAGEAEHRGDEGAGHADADEEDEVSDVQAPGEEVGHRGDGQAPHQLRDVGGRPARDEHEEEGDPKPPAPAVGLQGREQRSCVLFRCGGENRYGVVVGKSGHVPSPVRAGAGAGYMRFLGGR